MRWLLICIAVLVTVPSHAETIRLAVSVKHQRSLDLSQYEHGLLDLALREAGGDHEIILVPTLLNQGRALRSLEDGKAPFDVYYSGYSQAREQTFRMVRFPLTRGLLGKRMLMVQKTFRSELDGFTDLAQLAERVVVGSGATWPDTLILRETGFRVVTGEIDDLWRMLYRGRITAMHRSVYEISLGEKKGVLPEVNVPLEMEDRYILTYPFDEFYYLNRQDEAKALIIEKGLSKAFQNGSFDAYFRSHPHIATALEYLNRKGTKVFPLPSPATGEVFSSLPAHYWLNRED